MASKGIDYYAYLGSGGFQASFSKPTDLGKEREQVPLSTTGSMLAGNLQIEETDVDPLRQSGPFQWAAEQNGSSLASRYADLAPLTGTLVGSDMGVLLQTPSLLGPGYALSYGYYHSSIYFSPLTDQDQSYVYLTPNLSTWMGDLAGSEPALLDKPFAVFALPGAHDAGMFDPTCVERILGDPSFQAALAGATQCSLGDLLPDAILRVVIALAFTQKDDVATMLDLGVRYFDFRPGYCYDNIVSGIYHQHAFIPGYPYQSFLNDVFTWLQAHPSEIVVVNANFQGFSSGAMKPPVSVLESMVATAQSETGTQDIAVGDKSDLGSTLGSLLSANRRLIFLNQIGSPDDASKYDSYSDGAYTTTDVDSILQALAGMKASEQGQYDYTVLQLQGTATGLKAAVESAIANPSDASSPLMSTKADFDHSTYPWLAANVPGRLLDEKLIVFLNDFADNALAWYARSITAQRAGL